MHIHYGFTAPTLAAIVLLFSMGLVEPAPAAQQSGESPDVSAVATDKGESTSPGEVDIEDLLTGMEAAADSHAAAMSQPAGRAGTWDFSLRFGNELTYSERNRESVFNPGGVMDYRNLLDRIKVTGEVEAGYGPCLSARIKDTVMWRFDEDGAKSGDEANENYLQEALIRIRPGGRWNTDIGKVKYVGGVSYAWNPTDYFKYPTDIYGPIRDGLDVKEMRPGVYMVLGDLFLDSCTLTVAYAPELSGDEEEFAGNTTARYFLRCALSVFEDYNPEFSFHYGEYASYGVNWCAAVSDEAVLQFEVSLDQGAGVKTVAEGQPGGTPETPIRTFQFDQRDGDLYIQAAVGLNYTFESGANLITEYYYNGAGYDNGELEDYFDSLDYAGQRADDPMFVDAHGRNLYLGYIGAAGELFSTTTLGQHYAVVRISKDNFLCDDMGGTFTVATSLQDASTVLAPKLVYRISDHLTTSLRIQAFHGKRRSLMAAGPDMLTSMVEMIWRF